MRKYSDINKDCFVFESVSDDGKINYTKGATPFKTNTITPLMKFMVLEIYEHYKDAKPIVQKIVMAENVVLDNTTELFTFNKYKDDGTPIISYGNDKFEIIDELIIPKGEHSVIYLQSDLKDVYIMVVDGNWLMLGTKTMRLVLESVKLSGEKIRNFDPKTMFPTEKLPLPPKNLSTVQAIKLLKQYSNNDDSGLSRSGLLTLNNDLVLNGVRSITKRAVFKPDMAEFRKERFYNEQKEFTMVDGGEYPYYYTGEQSTIQYMIIFIDNNWMLLYHISTLELLENSHDKEYNKTLTSSINKLTQKQLGITLSLIKSFSESTNEKDYILYVGNTNDVYFSGYEIEDITDILSRKLVNDIDIEENIQVPFIQYSDGVILMYYDFTWYRSRKPMVIDFLFGNYSTIYKQKD